MTIAASETIILKHPLPGEPLPDHTQLPDSDGRFVKNLQEHPQSLLLTSSILPILQQRHPDGNYVIGQDSGIYWRLTEPPERGAEAPDWCYIPDVPPLVNGGRRRSYVLWKEVSLPLIAIEFTSGDGSEERDRTVPMATNRQKAGKFWVYEQAIQVRYYAIYEVEKASVEVYCLESGHYQRCQPNDRGHYPVPELGIELGIWQGSFMAQDLPWLRFWDTEGNLLLHGDERAELGQYRTDRAIQRAEQAENLVQQAQNEAEQEKQRAEQEKQRAEQEKQRAEQEKQRADQLAAKLRELGIDPATL